jgi:Arc/MetJ family transcription regulator
MVYMAIVKKTIELDENAIRKLRLIFDVQTDKEAVNRAIQLVASEDDIIQTHESLAGKIELEDLFS